ncbi:MFS transporter [Actinomadura sp. WMMA1423]|uniref:MFS transporter n=1 Tax=Actinomadura sp. WMMA1423 TaxID=2591108 RepID=UPI0011474DA1|nr:MFS transporter [Actinomadura sp. WMMA1423]
MDQDRRPPVVQQAVASSANGVAARASGAWRYRWTILGIATFTQAASAFFVQGIGAMGLHLQRDLHLSTAQLGLLISAAQLLPMAGLVVAGRLLDRHDERWVVGLGACLVGAALCAGSAVPGYASLLLVLLVVGAGYSTVQPGGSKSVASWFDASQRGFAMGVRQAGLPLGGALASAVLPLVAGAFGWRAALLTGGLVALLGAGGFMGLYRRPPARPPDPVDPRPGLRKRTHRETSLVTIVLSGTSLISVQCGVGILTVLYLHERTSVEAGAAALVLVASQGAGVAGRICLAAWSDRSGRGRYVAVMACMVAVIAGMSVLMTPLGRSPAAACAVFVWLGFFGLGWYGPWVAYVTESAPPDRTGSVLGLAMAANQIAIVLVPPGLGLLKDMTGGFSSAWGILTAMTAAALIVTARGPGRTPAGRPAREPNR